MTAILEGIFKGLLQWVHGLMLEIVEYIANVLLDVFGMDLQFFRSAVPVTDDIIRIITAAGWALLIGNLVFQALKSMASGLGFEGEEPQLLFTRTFVFSFLLLASRQVCDIGLGLSGTVIDLLQVPSSVTLPTLEETMFDIGASWLLVIIISVIIMWQVVKLFFEIGERYVVTALLTVLAPLAFSMGGSKNTADIFKGWCRMFGSMCLMMVFNVVCLKMLISALAHTPGGLEALPWTILIMGIARVARKIDSIITRLGLNPAITGDGLGRTMPGMLTYAVVRSIGSNVARTIGQNGAGAAKSGPSGGGPGGGSGGGSKSPTGPGGAHTSEHKHTYAYRQSPSGAAQTAGAPTAAGTTVQAGGKPSDGVPGTQGRSASHGGNTVGQAPHTDSAGTPAQGPASASQAAAPAGGVRYHSTARRTSVTHPGASSQVRPPFTGQGGGAGMHDVTPGDRAPQRPPVQHGQGPVQAPTPGRSGTAGTFRDKQVGGVRFSSASPSQVPHPGAPGVPGYGREGAYPAGPVPTPFRPGTTGVQDTRSTHFSEARQGPQAPGMDRNGGHSPDRYAQSAADGPAGIGRKGGQPTSAPAMPGAGAPTGMGRKSGPLDGTRPERPAPAPAGTGRETSPPAGTPPPMGQAPSAGMGMKGPSPAGTRPERPTPPPSGTGRKGVPPATGAPTTGFTPSGRLERPPGTASPHQPPSGMPGRAPAGAPSPGGRKTPGFGQGTEHLKGQGVPPIGKGAPPGPGRKYRREKGGGSHGRK